MVTVASGGEALETVAQHSPDALILDLQLPDVDGLQVCRRIREAGDDTPILMLTARHAIDDRVQGLGAGADDYLLKPFALEELLARLRALLRRRFEGEGGLLRMGPLTLDLSSREAHRGDRAFTWPRIRSTCWSSSSAILVKSSPVRCSSTGSGDLTSIQGRPRRVRRLPPAQDGSGR